MRNKYKDYLYDNYHRVFTIKNPKNTFIIDYSNGYPVKVTTNVERTTSWKDILCGNYDYANSDGTPEYLIVNGHKYTYIDYNWASQNGYRFIKNNAYNVHPYVEHNKTNKLFNKFFHDK